MLSSESHLSHKVYDEDIDKLRKILQQKSFQTSDEKYTQHQETSFLVNTEEVCASSKMDCDLSTDNPRSSACLCNCGVELEQITKERNELKARIHRGEASKASIQERQELERALHSAKSEIFRERKRSRLIIEDLEEKLEEIQNLYETNTSEKEGNLTQELTVKEEFIQSLLEKVLTLETTNEKLQDTIEMDKKTMLQYEKKIEELEGIKMKFKEQSMQYEDMHGTVTTECMKWRRLLNESEEREKEATKKCLLTISELENENKKLIVMIEDLTNKQAEISKELQNIKRENTELAKGQENIVEKNAKLININNCLKQEVCSIHSKKARFEVEMMKREKLHKKEFLNKEQEQKNEIKELHEKIECLQLEVADALLKARNGKNESDLMEKLLVKNISDQCQKLILLCKAMKPSKRFFYQFRDKELVSTQDAVSRLDDTVQLISHVIGHACDLGMQKSHKHSELKETLFNNFPNEELDTLRKQLKDKEDEIQRLKVNMTCWQDETTQHLSRKTQIERNSISNYTNFPTKSQVDCASPPNDSSTVKLLCHLQSRVKQLRSENDFLKSTSIVCGINDTEG